VPRREQPTCAGIPDSRPSQRAQRTGHPCVAAASEIKSLGHPPKQLRDENTKLKKLVVDLSLDKEMLKALIAKNGWSS
jgi:hypothetical protein